MYGADSPCSYTADYESVCGSGRAEIVTDEPSRLHALRVLLSHYTDRVFENESFEPRALAHTVVIRIVLDAVSGKRRIVRK